MRIDPLHRVEAPGLPPFPYLYFDPERRWAKVTARHPTWQSYESAIYATEAVVWITNGVLAWLIWHWLPPLETVIRIVLFVLGTAYVSIAVTYLLRHALREFFARRIFATRTTFLFTPEAIVFRSRLYAKPVVIWRMWHNVPVTVRFVAQPDIEASNVSENQPEKRKFPKQHLSQSQILEMVVHSGDRRTQVELSGDNNVLRSIPITEMDIRIATRFPLVCAAAALLTAPIQLSTTAGQQQGVDIDG